MEKSRLLPELQKIVDQLAIFRDKYTHLKTHCAAQAEAIQLQKIESEKMSTRVERLATALLDCKRCHDVTVRNLEAENQRLRNMLEDMRDKENACLTQGENHHEAIERLKKSHEEEILIYKKKLEAYEVSVRDRKQVERKNKQDEDSDALRQNMVTLDHPALDEAGTQRGRKKLSSSVFRWPKLDFAAKQEVDTSTLRWTPRTKKKKLYQADNEMIVDLAT